LTGNWPGSSGFLNDSALSAQVVLTDEKRGRRADVTLHARGEKFLRRRAGRRLGASLTQAFDKIAKQAQKVKEVAGVEAPGREGGAGPG
jgi:ribosome-associated translation inhibitor RaiA